MLGAIASVAPSLHPTRELTHNLAFPRFVFWVGRGRGREDQLKKKRAIHEIRRYKCHDNDNYHTLDQR